MINRIFILLTDYRFLFSQLLQREIKSRYKQSFIGYLWLIISPLSQLIVYTFVFSIVLRFPTQDVPYPLFLLVALLPWSFTQNSISAATNSLVINANLLKKVAFPREIIPLSVIFAKIIDLIVSYSIFFIFFMFYGKSIPISALLMILIFFIQLVLTIGISLLLSSLNLFYRDIQYLANLLLMLWMYISPIVYPLSMVPAKYQPIYCLNPLVGIIEAYRAVIFNTEINLQLLAYSLSFAVVLFLISYFLFKKMESYFADIV